MGRSVAALMADAYISLHERSFTSIILRYVDYLFCVLNCERHHEMYFAKLNTIHANIQFTKELERNNPLTYSDILQ